MMKSPRQLAVSAALAKSNACFARGVFGKVFRPIQIAITPNGILIANSHGHVPIARIAGGNRRAERERRSDHQRVMAEAAAEHMGRVDEADQRRVYAHDAAGAQPLQRPRGGQARQRPCEGATERGQREQQQAAEIDPLMADDFAERAERQQRRNQRDLIDVDHPDHVGRADMEVGGDGGQRDVGDRRIQRSQRQRGKDRRDRPAPEFRGQAVDGAAGGRLCGCIQ